MGKLALLTATVHSGPVDPSYGRPTLFGPSVEELYRDGLSFELQEFRAQVRRIEQLRKRARQIEADPYNQLKNSHAKYKAAKFRLWTQWDANDVNSRKRKSWNTTFAISGATGILAATGLVLATGGGAAAPLLTLAVISTFGSLGTAGVSWARTRFLSRAIKNGEKRAERLKTAQQRVAEDEVTRLQDEAAALKGQASEKAKELFRQCRDYNPFLPGKAVDDCCAAEKNGASTRLISLTGTTLLSGSSTGMLPAVTDRPTTTMEAQPDPRTEVVASTPVGTEEVTTETSRPTVRGRHRRGSTEPDGPLG